MESARFTASLGMHECTACRMNPPAYNRAVAFAPYDNEMREMLHTLKFGRVQRVAESLLSGWLAEAILQLESDIRNQFTAALLVVPVPLFGTRQKERGYNQAELLARSSVRQLRKLRPGWALELRPEGLRRVRDTKAMFQLRPDQRRRNLVGAFEADSAIVRGRQVLLVDDILTTGATANQCAKVLLKAGASAVWVATVARAQPEGASAVAHDVARWDAAGVNGFGSRTAADTEQTARLQQSKF